MLFAKLLVLEVPLASNIILHNFLLTREVATDSQDINTDNDKEYTNQNAD